MMKIFPVIIISVLIGFSAYSQTSEFSQVTTSKIFPAEKVRNLKGFFKLKSGKTVTIRDVGEFVEIISYNEDFSQKSKSELIKFTYKQNDGKNYFKSTFLTKEDKVIIIFEQKFKKQKKIIIWANILNLENEELELSEPVKLTEINYRDQINDYHISFNKEISKFVFVDYKIINEPKKNNIISYSVFDTNLEKLWENNLDDIYVYSSPAGMFRIADNGKVVTVIPVKDETVKKRDKTQQKALFYIFIFDFEGSLESNMSLKMNPNTFLKDFNITIDSSNKIRASGAYSENIKSEYSVGGINFSIDLNDIEEPEYRMYKFTTEALTTYETPRIVKKFTEMSEKGKNPGLRYLSVIDIISHENGYYSIMEKKWGVTNQKTGATTYFYRDYFVSSFSNDDELFWIKKVPIELRTTVNGFFNESFIFKNENLYFIHFDAEANFTNFIDVKNGKSKV